MTYSLTQKFTFDAAHTLAREIERAGSARIHGHTYQAEITISGAPHPSTGMIVDLGVVRRRIEAMRGTLDHQFLDEVAGLGVPTLENLCNYIARSLSDLPAQLTAVRVWRESSGDGCVLQLT